MTHRECPPGVATVRAPRSPAGRGTRLKTERARVRVPPGAPSAATLTEGAPTPRGAMAPAMSDQPPVPPGALPPGAPPATYPSGPPLAPPASPVPAGALRPAPGWVTAPPRLPPPRRAVPTWVLAVAIIAALALVGGVLAAVTGDDADDVGADRAARERDDDPGGTGDDPGSAGDDPGGDPGGGSGPSTSVPGTDPGDDPGSGSGSGPVDEAELDEVVADIEAFVEAERGLSFLEPVDVQLVDDATFDARVLRDFDEGIDDLVTYGHVLEAVGLLEPGTDVVEALRRLLGSQVLGLYDQESNELFVLGTELTPNVRISLAHELAHALEDQHFELHRPELADAMDESAGGFRVLTEGSATVIGDAYRASFSDAEQEEALAEELANSDFGDLLSIPPVLYQDLALPYLVGPPLIQALLDDGGQARLDAAFAAPPTTSEQLLDPDRYLAREPAVDVAAPPADGAVVDEGVVGAIGVATLLDSTSLLLPGAGLDPAVDGWGGDHYVAWDDLDGDGTCLRADLVGDTDDDTDELYEALDAWSDGVGDGGADGIDVEVTVELLDLDTGGGVVRLTSCS